MKSFTFIESIIILKIIHFSVMANDCWRQRLLWQNVKALGILWINKQNYTITQQQTFCVFFFSLQCQPFLKPMMGCAHGQNYCVKSFNLQHARKTRPVQRTNMISLEIKTYTVDNPQSFLRRSLFPLLLLIFSQLTVVTLAHSWVTFTVWMLPAGFISVC